jgi:hypothetical protein
MQFLRLRLHLLKPKKKTENVRLRKKNPPRRNPEGIEVSRGREKKTQRERREKRHARIDQHAQVHDDVGVVEGREEAVGLCQRWIKGGRGQEEEDERKRRGVLKK